MCKDNAATKTKSRPIIMTSVESFSEHDGKIPGTFHLLTTSAAVLCVFTGLEFFLRYFINANKHVLPLLEDETNRQILARHLGTDVVGCFWVAYLGWNARHVCQDMTDRVLKRTNSMPDAGHEQRIFTYQPEAFRLLNVFFAYQIKNMFDCIVWGDGPEYVFHHFMSMAAAYSGLGCGVGHFYAIFFMGVSEISTGILCFLANFDPDHGVPGLAEALPATKMVNAGLFVFFFIICRVIMWPIATYFCARDITMCLNGESALAKKNKFPLHAVRCALVALSVLQLVFLAQIVIIGRQELAAMSA